jgi:hypothetical protein
MEAGSASEWHFDSAAGKTAATSAVSSPVQPLSG